MPETKPVRLQLSRKKGFRLQEHSRAVNGLPAVNVTRPGKWGNSYRVGNFGQALAVSLYRRRLSEALLRNPVSGFQALDELAGKNLACWCKPGEPCHADVLLELANKEPSDA